MQTRCQELGKTSVTLDLRQRSIPSDGVDLGQLLPGLAANSGKRDTSTLRAHYSGRGVVSGLKVDRIRFPQIPRCTRGVRASPLLVAFVVDSFPVASYSGASASRVSTPRASQAG